MASIAVIGRAEFCLGFQLAGIRDTIVQESNPLATCKDMKKRKEVGIVIVDQALLEMLEQVDRQEIESSIDPVFIPLSTSVEQEGLRRLIKKSIGIDIWK